MMRAALLLSLNDKVGVDGTGQVLDVRSIELRCLVERLVWRAVCLQYCALMIVIDSVDRSVVRQRIASPLVHCLPGHKVAMQVRIPADGVLLPACQATANITAPAGTLMQLRSRVIQLMVEAAL